MQAKLKSAELAYLLHLLEAQKVVGVDNAQLFPGESTTRDELLSAGFSGLKEAGWFVAADGKINANNRLILMAAVLANPDYVFTATHFAEADTRQTITYYVASDFVVEQFMTADGDYLLTQLPSVATLEERLAQVFALEGEDTTPALPLKFKLTPFETALSQAKAGASTALRQMIEANNVPPDNVDGLVETICKLQPVGKIEGAAIAGLNLVAWHELALLRDNVGVQWLIRKNDTDNTLELAPASESQFRQKFQQLFDLLAQARHVAVDIQMR